MSIACQTLALDGFAQASLPPPPSLSFVGYVRVDDVSINGVPVKLLLDTGSNYVIWLA